MTTDTGSEYQERADEARAQEDFQHAGKLYTLAAYEHLGATEHPSGQGLSSATALGDAIYCLQSAAVDFTKAGLRDRAKNRCRQGILVAEDFREYVSEYAAIDGVLTESIADFQVIAATGDPASTYDDAISEYQSAGEPERWQSEPVFQSTLHFVVELASYVGDPVSETAQIELMRSFDRRVAFKRERLPPLIRAITD